MKPSLRLIHGDARKLPAVAGGTVELVVTSPPYPMLPQWDALFRELGATSFEAMHDCLEEVWRECYRVLVPGGILAINVGDALRTTNSVFRLWQNHASILERCSSAGFLPLPYILWKKPTNRPNAFLGSGMVPPNAYVTLDCEFVLLFRKGPPRSFPQNDLKRSESRYSRAERDLWFSQVWSGIRGARQGPEGRRSAAFPAEIPRRLIRMFSVRGETVLDPFAGTGTTLWAALELGRSAVGVERDGGAYLALIRRGRVRSAEVGRAGPGARPPRRRRASGSAAPRH